MIKSDVHMHTCFSHDSKAKPEDMVKGAIEKGLAAICFTDHYDKDDFDWGEEYIFDPDQYFEVLRPLQEKYKHKIEVRIGVEIGLQPHLAEFYHGLVNEYPFDFVIGSVHSAQAMDLAARNIFEGKTDKEVYGITFAETLTDVQTCSDFDVLGHVDYVVRYGANKEHDYSYDTYAESLDAVLRVLIEKGKGLELNMAGLKYGLSFAHPHMDILKKYKEMGGEIITIGADGHCPEHIAYDWHKVEDILKECGFQYYTEFIQRKPVFIKTK